MRNKIGGAVLALAAVFGIFAATPTTTQAQWRNDDGYYRRDRNNDTGGEGITTAIVATLK